MKTLTLTSKVQHVSPLVSSIHVTYIVYDDKRSGQLAFIKLGEHGVSVLESATDAKISSTDEWLFLTCHVSELPDVIDEHGEIIWDSPTFKQLPDFVEDQDWVVNSNLNGEQITVTGDSVDHWLLQSYGVYATKTNMKQPLLRV